MDSAQQGRQKNITNGTKPDDECFMYGILSFVVHDGCGTWYRKSPEFATKVKTVQNA